MSKLTLDSVNWGVFRLKEIFEVENCKCSKVSGLEKGMTPYAGATNQNNGTISYLKKYDSLITKGNCIVFVCEGEGSMGYSYYKHEDFIGTTTIKVGRNRHLNKFNGMFISTVADTVRGKYNFGYKRNELRLKNETLTLPINKEGKPNWKFMEDYIKQEMKLQSEKVVSYYENKLMKLGFELLDYDVDWKEFKVKELFEVKPVKGKSITNYKEGKIPYITTSSINNGLNSFIDTEDNISIKNCISIDPIGGKSFYHDYDFVGRGGAGSAINLLYNNNIDKYSGLFICRVLESSSFSKASYGVQLNGNRLKNLKLLLPIDKNDEPHWEYMSQFMKKLEKENIEKTLNHIYIYIMVKKIENKYLLENVSWKEFFIEDICEIKSGKDIYERDRIDGHTPYVTATANNNGIGYFISNKNTTLQEKCISVNRNGSVGYSFYHSYSALFGNDTRKLIPKYSDDHVAKFISFMISSQKEKYGYGYKMGTARLKRQKILLPINKDESINYDFMKKYILIQEIISIYSILDCYK